MRSALTALMMLPLICMVSGCVTNVGCEVGNIIRSDVSAAEKGRRLAEVLRPGMPKESVRKALGAPDDVDGYGPGWEDWTYYEYQLLVSFDANRRLVSARPLQDDGQAGFHSAPTTRPSEP